jgi:hypothetical protein
MLAANSVTSPEIALPLMVVLSTLLAKLAISAVKLVTVSISCLDLEHC